MEQVAGRVAVITGGASGIGRGIAEAFAAAGMKLVLADVDDEAARVTAEALREGGSRVITVHTDVSNAHDVDGLAQRALGEYGAIHVVCNNAGVAYGGVSTWESPLEHWNWVVGVNLMGVVHGVRAFAPILVEQGEGHIVNTASIAGLITVGGNALYATTKHAVVALSESLFNELAAVARGVHVSVLCPGFVNTSLVRTSARHEPESGDSSARLLFQSDAARQLQSLLERATPPSEIGKAVLSAILEERFWILPHREFKTAIRQRCENILEERPPLLAGSAAA